MKINTNISSLTAQRYLANTTKAIGRALERLASGKRINSAKDDPAGLSLSTKLDASRRGLLRGIQNINESVGYLETADSAISSQLELAQRMRELAMQAANGTLSRQDRTYLDTEFKQLIAEFDRISTQTAFGGVNLIDGSFSTRSIQLSGKKDDTISLGIDSTRASTTFTRTTSDGSFGSANAYSTNTALVNFASGDFNKDGKDDILASDQFVGAGSRIYLSNGDGTFTISTTIGAGLLLGDQAIGDFTGDGNLDIVMKRSATTDLYLYKGRGDGTFYSPTTFADTTTNYGSLMQAKDLNGDGKLDLVSGNGNTPAIYLGNGRGGFTLTQTLAMNGASVIQLGDIDNDGDIDMISGAQGSNDISVALNNGAGVFQTPTSVNIGAPTNDLKLADFDGDGRLDFASVYGVSIRLYKGQGSPGSFSLMSTINPGGATLRSLAIGDFNADDAIDIVATDPVGGWAKTYLNNGSGSFTASSTLSLATAWGAVTLDLNGDAVSDIALSDSGTSFYAYKNQAYTASALPVLELSTQSRAQKSLSIIDNALDSLLGYRASIGAQRSRLDFANEYASNASENISKALSEAVDVDYASETAELVRSQILQQAQVSVLGQANLQLQMVLKLLKF